jgi:hypothetical protein
MARIFISYRRADLDERIVRLRQSLQTQFGEDNVFFDVMSLRPGEIFTDRIRTSVRKCHVLLAVIGRQWSGTSTAIDGGSRLDDDDDFVRLEVATALKYRVEVIPVLISGATLPSRDDLPPTLWPLLQRQVHEVRAEHVDEDVRLLVAHINHKFRLIPWET